MNNNRYYLCAMGNDKISFKQINRLAIPAIFAGVVEPLISITDTAIAGRLEMNTVESIAGVGLVGAFISTLIWIFAQTKSAISTFVSQAYGSNNITDIRPLFSQIFWMNFAISIIILVLSYFFAEDIFKIYSVKGLALDYCVEYYRIRAFGFPLTLLTFSIFGAFRGLQNTYWAMGISIIGGSLNMILDHIFAIQLDMHIEGIAYASLISQFVMFILALYYLFSKTPFSLKLQMRAHHLLGKALSMTINLIIRTASLNIALFLANRYATSYGNHYIDAQSILMQIWLFSAFILDGYSNAGNAIAGRLIGAKDFKRLWKLSIDLSKSMLIVVSILMLVYAVLYNKIVLIFAPSVDGIIYLFREVFWLVILMQPINAIAFLFDGIFKGLGEAVKLRNVLIAATFIGFIPSLLILDIFDLKLYAIWGSFFVWMIIRGGGLVFIFRRKYQMRNNI